MTDPRDVEQRVLEVPAGVHRRDLLDQVERVAVRAAAVAQRFLVAAVVAAHGEHVVDAEVLELDQEVLGLLAGEALAQDVGHGVEVVLVLDQRAEAERARALALDPALDPLRGLLVDHLRRVAGDVDERRPVDDELVDQRQEIAYVAAPERRDDLEADQRAVGAREVLGDFHRGAGIIAGRRGASDRVRRSAPAALAR